MEDFVYEYHSEGFFGYSETPLFKSFSIAHLLPIFLLAVGKYLAFFTQIFKILAFDNKPTH